MSPYSEEELARLLEGLPLPPRSWTEAAKELPRMRSEIDGIVDRAVRDAAYRRSITTAMERALEAGAEGHDREVLERLRDRLASGGEG